MSTAFKDRNPLQPSVTRRTAEAVAVETIRRAILHGEIRGGARLIQHELATDLGLSTTPVREALRVLAAEGLVDFDAHRGAVVRDVKDDEMREILWLRSLLEPDCMRLTAARALPEELDHAHDILDQMDHETDVSRWTALNREFHASLCDASRSVWLASLLASLRSASAIYLVASLRAAPEPMVAGNREHRELLAALRRRDEDAAAQIALNHVRAMGAGLADRLTPATADRQELPITGEDQQ